MVATSTHLINHVLPAVPPRQRVLSFPGTIRLLLSTRPEIVTLELAILMRAIESSLIPRAGLTRTGGAGV